MRDTLQSLRFWVSLFLLMSGVAACGGGGSTAPGSGNGKAAIFLTDQYEEKITDEHGGLITTAQEVRVTFSEVSLKLKQGGWIPVFSGPPNKSVDLLSLRGRAELVSLIDLPPGDYDKARFKIEEASFVDSEGVRHDVIVPSDRITLKFKRHLVITADNTAEILFDFVPGKSIHLIETGSGKYILRPVIRVRVTGEQEETDFIKVRGRVLSIDCSAGRLTIDPLNGDPITVNLEDALIVQKDGSSDDGREHGGAGSIAACQQLQAGQFVEVIGTAEENGVHASVVQIKNEEPTGRLEFTGTLLEVDCSRQTIRVTFSEGEIEVAFRPETEMTADDQTVPSPEVCDRLKEAVQKRIEVEGRVENGQVIAAEITLLPAAKILPTRLEGSVASITAGPGTVTGFVLRTDAGQSYTVTINDQTQVIDSGGAPVSPNNLLNQRVRVEGTVDTRTSPNPTIAADEVRLISTSL